MHLIRKHMPGRLGWEADQANGPAALIIERVWLGLTSHSGNVHRSILGSSLVYPYSLSLRFVLENLFFRWLAHLLGETTIYSVLHLYYPAVETEIRHILRHMCNHLTPYVLRCSGT